MEKQPTLKASQISKHYPGVQALDKVDFDLYPGEVRALLGKNGAGKSTLVKVLSGAIRQDSGDVFVDGEPVSINSPSDAFNVGIATVYQEMSLVMGLSVAENILLGRWPHRNILGWNIVNRRDVLNLAREALDLMGADLDLDAPIFQLSVPQQQMVEIAKAASFKPKVLILDEPTSSLPEAEVDHLLVLIRQLAANGVAIIYVSHRLQEIPRVADNLTVLRDGKLVDTISIADSSPQIIANMMVGGEWTRSIARTSAADTSKVRLSVRHLNRRHYLHDISFDLYEGEVLGIAGLLGSGRTELLRAIFGLDKIENGEIFVDGQKVENRSIETMKAKGIGFLPEDRKAEGLVLRLSVEDNLTMASFARISHGQIISQSAKHALATEMVDAMSIMTPSVDVVAESLSGGNQQKLVIGKWLNAQVHVLLMDEPTRGIDVHAKEQVYGLVRNLAQQGISIIFVSSELEEVLYVADRILVLNRGRIIKEISSHDADLEEILALAMKEEEEILENIEL
jgi:ABC-type sugar transport system ATPase subunit